MRGNRLETPATSHYRRPVVFDRRKLIVLVACLGAGTSALAQTGAEVAEGAASAAAATQEAASEAEGAAEATEEAASEAQDGAEAAEGAASEAAEEASDAAEEAGDEAAEASESATEATEEAAASASDAASATEQAVDSAPPQATDGEEIIPGMRRQVVELEAPPEVETNPLRMVYTLGVGGSLRLVKNLQFQQSRFAPLYIELGVGAVLPGSGMLRHQLGLQVNTNLTSDGPENFGVSPVSQWTITPSYTARLAFGDEVVPDFLLGIRGGVPITVSPDFSIGGELSVSGTYMILAGFGVYLEATGSLFFGANSREGNITAHPLLSAELGVAFDLEVL